MRKSKTSINLEKNILAINFLFKKDSNSEKDYFRIYLFDSCFIIYICICVCVYLMI
jgi:glycopeptide antibiotics resistance protein